MTVLNPLVGASSWLGIGLNEHLGDFEGDPSSLRTAEAVVAEALRAFPSEEECVRRIAGMRTVPDDYSYEAQAYCRLLSGDERGFSEIVNGSGVLTYAKYSPSEERLAWERARDSRVLSIRGASRADALELIAQWRNEAANALVGTEYAPALEPESISSAELHRFAR
ncbi:hypothetical protein M6D93_13470 [Jatrophihabitans telluris]|uniref:Uncharacterized protein n=1 Tax=Jatrophihabitans telluris TaxID=2038343 RepID=A0ABY4QW83_9ACTN|nr:hypothetical protein [Jatrophihabitans telluris]UQX87306.1 hypothetical protein M6D93_13470 [Jatrophihabitans telluris]